MTIQDVDIKKLWGLAAGRCSFPGCGIDCLPFLDDNPVVIGEMAHVIAKQPKGPRGIGTGGSNTYDNLILLCPTHHRLVDKAPDGTFTEKMLHEWKDEHEKRVKESLNGTRYSDPVQMAMAIKRLLIENHTIWENFGPESDIAIENPLSNMYKLWNLRKLDTIVPNNHKIISIIEANKEIFDLEDLKVCYEFIEHANSFEQNCYSKIDGAKRFPKKFQEVIDKYAEIQ